MRLEVFHPVAEGYRGSEFQDRYFNSGCWTEKPCHFLAVRDGRVEVQEFYYEDTETTVEISAELTAVQVAVPVPAP